MTDELTEFTWIDPDEVHLVGMPANGFAAPLLAKAAEALDEQASYSEDGMVKYVSADARRKYAKSGVAMPNGDFPIPDEGHLRSAVGHLGNYTGDRSKAKAHIIKRAKALGLTHLLPEDWHVSKDAAKQTAPDKAFPTGEAESQTEEVSEDVAEGCDPEPNDGGEPRHVAAEDEHVERGDGQGDTAPDKSEPRAEAEGQTDGAQKGAPDSDAETGRSEHEEQTDEVEKDTPGSSEWEHQDVALGEKAEQLVSRLGEVVHNFTEREKAEGGASKELRRAAKAARSLLKNTDKLRYTAERINEMSDLDVVKVLGAYDADRRAEKKARKDAEAKKAAKREKKAAKAAEKAAKATGEPTADPELVKARAELSALQERVEKMASEDAKRIVTDPTGIVTALRGGPESAANVFKQLEDELAAAKEVWEKNPSRANESRMQEAGRRVVNAKLIAQDNARIADPQHTARMLRGEGVPLFNNSRPFNDPKVQYDRGR